jgi:hypothetical protein
VKYSHADEQCFDIPDFDPDQVDHTILIFGLNEACTFNTPAMPVAAAFT